MNQKYLLNGRMIALALAVMSVVSQAYSAVVGFTVDNTAGQTLGNPPFTLGFLFRTDTPILVTGLGLFDDGLDGLVEAHPIGLFDSFGNLVASTTVLSGTGSSLINQFRYESITPAALPVGQYSIGALYTAKSETGSATESDRLLFPGDALSFATAPGISFIQNRFIAGGTLQNPSGSQGTVAAYFGPNFTFAAVPEPSTYVAGALLLLPLGAGIIRKLRSIRQVG